jgi:hypothetical protein
MAQLYSVLIFEGHNLPSHQTVTLDPSYVWIVRDIDVFFPGADTEAQCSVIASVVGATFFQVAEPVVDNPGFWVPWRGRQVFQPPATGPTLEIISGGVLNGSDVRISGYRLTPP